MKQAFLLVFLLAGLHLVGQEKPKEGVKVQKTEQVQKNETAKAVQPAQKEVPKVNKNKTQIQKTQQQRKQVKNAQMQQHRSVQNQQKQKMVQRRRNHK